MDNLNEKLSNGVQSKPSCLGAINGRTIPDIMAYIANKMAEAEENCIKEVLMQMLKREPTLEDLKDLHKLQKEGKFDKYCLVYKNFKLGMVYRIFNLEESKVRCDFIPFETNNFL